MSLSVVVVVGARLTGGMGDDLLSIHGAGVSSLSGQTFASDVCRAHALVGLDWGWVRGSLAFWLAGGLVCILIDTQTFQFLLC